MDASRTKKSSTMEATQANESSGRIPIWDDASDRVKCAIWKHDQKGRFRYTVALYRSYKDAEGHWVNVHYFDRNDLDDVVKLAKAAQDHIARLTEGR